MASAPLIRHETLTALVSQVTDIAAVDILNGFKQDSPHDGTAHKQSCSRASCNSPSSWQETGRVARIHQKDIEAPHPEWIVGLFFVSRGI
jgi:hypothetical protein